LKLWRHVRRFALGEDVMGDVPARLRGLAGSITAIVALLMPVFVWAQDAALPDAAAPAQGDNTSWSIAYDIDFAMAADRTAVRTQTTRVTVLSEGGVQGVGQQTLGVIEGMQTLEILDAYTQKKDGRKIAVDPATIITRDAASGLNAMYIRDVKLRTVIFPDLAVGDTTVLTSKLTVRSGLFPDNFMYHILFSRSVAVADSTVRVAAPVDMPLKVGVYGPGLDHQVTNEANTTRHTILYHSQPRIAAELGATSPFDRDPRVLISTFQSYEDQAQSYWQMAAPQARVTPEIQTLAETITKGLDDRRAQAVAIDRWVKTNIRYVSVSLGSSRVVPNAAESVLKNKYGDCKDHATLMSALLAAKGIASEHVLISAGASYTLPEPPTMGYINHVILYLPEFGIYDDPTVSTAAFGVLAAGTYDKPVVHASEKGAYRARTPAVASDHHSSISRTHMTVATDGTVTGETEQTATGIFAITARTLAAGFQNAGLESSAEKVLRGYNTPGKGRFEIGPVSALDQSYVIKGRFTLSEPLKLTSGMPVVIPYGLPVSRRPGNLLFGTRHAGRTQPFSCYAGRQVEEIAVDFADGVPLPKQIKGGRTVKADVFSYVSDFRLEGRTLKISREFVSRVPGQVCAPELENAVAGPLKEVAMSLSFRMNFPKEGSKNKPADAPSAEGGVAPRRVAPSAKAGEIEQPTLD
jgi:transglutaminase-like putative cysteine protease